MADEREGPNDFRWSSQREDVRIAQERFASLVRGTLGWIAVASGACALFDMAATPAYERPQGVALGDWAALVMSASVLIYLFMSDSANEPGFRLFRIAFLWTKAKERELAQKELNLRKRSED